MKLDSGNDRLSRPRNAARPADARRTIAAVERMEERQLLAADFALDPTTKILTIKGSSTNDVARVEFGLQATVTNGGAPAAVLDPTVIRVSLQTDFGYANEATFRKSDVKSVVFNGVNGKDVFTNSTGLAASTKTAAAGLVSGGLTPIGPAVLNATATDNVGVFVVGASGKVTVDYLYDGAGYNGQLGIFSLTGMEKFTPGTAEYNNEVARRVLSDSTLGHVVISVAKETSKFDATVPWENNFHNGHGTYQGPKTFAMKPGDTFATVLVPSGTFQDLAKVSASDVNAKLKAARQANAAYDQAKAASDSAAAASKAASDAASQAASNVKSADAAVSKSADAARATSSAASAAKSASDKAAAAVTKADNDVKNADSAAAKADAAIKPADDNASKLAATAATADSTAKTAEDAAKKADSDAKTAEDAAARAEGAASSKSDSARKADDDARKAEDDASKADAKAADTKNRAKQAADNAQKVRNDRNSSDDDRKKADDDKKKADDDVKQADDDARTCRDGATKLRTAATQSAADARTATDGATKLRATATSARASANTALASATKLRATATQAAASAKAAADAASKARDDAKQAHANADQARANATQAKSDSDKAAAASKKGADDDARAQAALTQARAQAAQAKSDSDKAAASAKSASDAAKSASDAAKSAADSCNAANTAYQTAAGGSKQPIYSINVANVYSSTAALKSQIADLDGHGDLFALEDLRTDGSSDRDFNDMVFQITGAKGFGPDCAKINNPSKNFLTTDIFKSIDEYADTQLSKDTSQAGLLKTFTSISNDYGNYSSGVFTVGDSGQVTTDFLFDGGGYQSEVGIFSLKGMAGLAPGSADFIKEAVRRALSDSTQGRLIISDRTEGAKISGKSPWETDYNGGAYLGVKSFAMTPGDQFATIMLPAGMLWELYNNPALDGKKAPLFSIPEANPKGSTQLGDLTGEGTVVGFEDMRLDSSSDKDYNDVIVRFGGATVKAPAFASVVNTAKNFLKTDIVKTVLA